MDLNKLRQGLEEAAATASGDPDFEFSPEQAMELLKQAGGNAGLAAALQGDMAKLIGSSSGFIESLPKSVRRRVSALQDLQSDHDDIEEEYRKEREELEAKYRVKYAPLYTKRKAIVTGAEEPEAKKEEEGEEEEEDKSDDEGEETKGIPDFWLCVLRNNETTEESITEKDSEALRFLSDIQAEPLTGEEEKGFKLSFFFDSNPFFENDVLTKTYHMIDEEDPILEHAEGTEIQWKAGKNLTVKVMKKKPKKGKAGGKPLTKTEPCDSFFNFFSPPKIPEDGEEMEEEEMEQLQEFMETDYEIGATIKDRLIPHAISWFTGEASQMDDEDDEDDDEDDEDEDDEDAEDGEEGSGGVPALTDTGEKPPECKQHVPREPGIKPFTGRS